MLNLGGGYGLFGSTGTTPFSDLLKVPPNVLPRHRQAKFCGSVLAGGLERPAAGLDYADLPLRVARVSRVSDVNFGIFLPQAGWLITGRSFRPYLDFVGNGFSVGGSSRKKAVKR